MISMWNPWYDSMPMVWYDPKVWYGYGMVWYDYGMV